MTALWPLCILVLGLCAMGIIVYLDAMNRRERVEERLSRRQADELRAELEQQVDAVAIALNESVAEIREELTALKGRVSKLDMGKLRGAA